MMVLSITQTKLVKKILADTNCQKSVACFSLSVKHFQKPFGFCLSHINPQTLKFQTTNIIQYFSIFQESNLNINQKQS